jgi:hypothetical protein
MKRLGLALLTLWAVLATLVATAPANILSPPRFWLFVSEDNQYVSAVGTWALEGDEIADPISTTTIKCFRTEMQCVEATASVPESLNILTQVQIIHLKITQWENNFLTISNTSTLCNSSVISIDLKMKTVKSLSTRLDAKPACSELLSKKEARAYLADGFAIKAAEQIKRQPKISRVISEIFK